MKRAIRSILFEIFSFYTSESVIFSRFSTWTMYPPKIAALMSMLAPWDTFRSCFTLQLSTKKSPRDVLKLKHLNYFCSRHSTVFVDVKRLEDRCKYLSSAVTCSEGSRSLALRETLALGSSTLCKSALSQLYDAKLDWPTSRRRKKSRLFLRCISGRREGRGLDTPLRFVST